MRDKAADAARMAIKRNDFLEKGFELFSTKTIEAVSMQDVADASGYGVATLYRYFTTKNVFVVEVATWKWDQFREENLKLRSEEEIDRLSAAQHFEHYLDSFLRLYTEHRDILRFNQFFNMYVQSEDLDAATLKPYREMIARYEQLFHNIYLKAKKDKTIRTDVSEKEMFSTTLHLMLAAITRYAVGLVYIPEEGFDTKKELCTMKDMLLARYQSEEARSLKCG